LDINLMIEAQAGVYWPEWQRLVRAAEDLGFDGLYRSDHYPQGSPPERNALELWTSLTWLAANTERIAFGSLVTPAAFRHPANTAWAAMQLHDLSGGRLRLGLGAGWNEREHTAFGHELLAVRPRFRRFEEYLKVVLGLLRSGEPLTFTGRYYQLQGAMLMPQPQDGGPPVTIGGNGPQMTLPLVARYADEWNCFWRTRGQLLQLGERLDDLLAAQGRAPDAVRRTMMVGVFFGRSDAELASVLGARGQSAAELRAAGALVGTAGALRDQLGELADLGLDGVMLQWLDVHEFDRLEALAKAVL
jgi:F420-dependent oxidoreductase-like protein